MALTSPVAWSHIEVKHGAAGSHIASMPHAAAVTKVMIARIDGIAEGKCAKLEPMTELTANRDSHERLLPPVLPGPNPKNINTQQLT